MDNKKQLLYILNQKRIYSQRMLAKELGISVGKVNYLLRELVNEELIKKQEHDYQMTERGLQLLEDHTRENLEQKLEFGEEHSKTIKTAVILAAGENKAFSTPVGLLKIDEIPLVEHLIGSLLHQGIEKIVLVVGAQKEQYEEYFAKRQIILVENSRYKWTGTMASLYAVREHLTEDFLLLDGNQLLEEAAIARLLGSKRQNSMLLAAPSGSKDEAYVELDDKGGIFRISKDIKQLNCIDGELVGAVKISAALFGKMKEYFSVNENPFLNYEYAIENIGRIYHIEGVMVDDLIFGVVENQELYEKAANILYPKIKKRRILCREERAREALERILHLNPEDIEEVRSSGGMTNHNYLVKIRGEEFVLRMPGACTEIMIDRTAEEKNTILAAQMGLHPEVAYMDALSGVKITKYIEGALTLNGPSARLEKNMKSTSGILRTLHQSDMKMENRFSFETEYRKYKKMVSNQQGSFYEGFLREEDNMTNLMADLEELDRAWKPCHNDLVPENFVSSGEGRMYLIDWEYAGLHDPMWDVAAHLLEGEFTKEEEELYLEYYFEKQPKESEKQKLAIFKIFQDMLWSVWTIAKEAKGEDFGSYGQERFKRAINMRREYEKKYK